MVLNTPGSSQIVQHQTGQSVSSGLLSAEPKNREKRLRKMGSCIDRIRVLTVERTEFETPAAKSVSQPFGPYYFMH
ncbi:MAG: hypothetical protein GY820_24295 [Gammaproteobacteria bacterium]|nr:hypothetical protein [Gammaproteobacteria bacterium]